MQTTKISPVRACSLAVLALCFASGTARSAPSASSGKTNEPGARIVEGSTLKVDEYYPPPNGTQRKTRIEAAKAMPSRQGNTTLISQVKVQTWLANGEPELIIEAPECTHDSKNKVIYSPGPLSVHAADGRFSIEGEGFILFQTNSLLLISNKVHTIVHPSVLASAPTGPEEARPGEKAIEVFADHFEYVKDPGLGTYEGHVRMAGTNLAMTCGKLQVQVPLKLRALENIHATSDVVMDYEMGDHDIRTIHATGDDAVYYATNGLTIVTGHPTWRADLREGRGDELTIDATNKVFRAAGNAFLKIPSASFGETMFLPQQNSSSAPAPGVTNQFIQVLCDHYVFQTNLASFGDQVRVIQTSEDEPVGTMTCSRMLLQFSGTNQVQRMVADQNVVIQQTTNQFQADKAVYTGTNHLLTLTGDPKWRSGPREGKGDLILVNVRNQEMAVRTNALMRVPANELGYALSSAPPTQRTNDPVAPKSDRGGPPAPQFADITSEEYYVKTNSAVFNGGVRITHPNMDWACGSMTVNSDPAGGKETKMTAEHTVEFHFTRDEGKALHGTCDKAVYTYNVSARATNELAILTGDPVLETADGTIKNNIIILDRANHQITAPGKYKLYGRTANTSTNVLELFKKTLNPPTR